MASSRYMSSHLTHAELARTYAERLGYRGLGAGLRPVGD